MEENVPSFVDDLEIAHDAGLLDLRLPERTAKALRRDGPGASRGPEAVDEKLRAAVNAGSIISFVAGVTRQEKSDVLFSTQVAQRAASAKFDRFTATQDWYRFYSDVLERLGWVGESFAFTERDSTAGKFSMDKSALDIIAEIATGGQLAILVKTVDTLKKLADDDRALTIFDLQALRELSGNFQIGAAQRADNGALSLAIGAFHFKTLDHHKRILFWQWGAESIHFWTAAGKKTLNSEFYAKHRQAVIEKLKDATDYIAGLEIA